MILCLCKINCSARGGGNNYNRRQKEEEEGVCVCDNIQAIFNSVYEQKENSKINDDALCKSQWQLMDLLG